MPEAESVLRSRRLLRALAAHGVGDAVYCPGSRDAPLGYALAEAEQAGWLRVHVRLDERSAGFMALGLSRASIIGGRPAPTVVVTTSGTAVANLHPAVLEADASSIPLLVLTADRPHEMWHTGANQTTLQSGIYGAATRFAATIPAGFPADARLDGLAGRAVAAATGALSHDPGPVQLDVCFRDPLVPAETAAPAPAPEPAGVSAGGVGVGTLRMPARGVVVAGDAAGPAAVEFAERAGWPLLAEPTSGARFGANALTDYQRLLATDLVDDIESVLVLGHPTLSRPVSRLLAGTGVTVVTDSPRWTDVAGAATVITPPDRVICPSPRDPSWLPRWQEADSGAEPGSAKDRACAAIWATACQQTATSPRTAPALMIGASAVIRSFDRYASPAATAPVAVANRGLAGIDGTVSTAVGLSAGLGRPVRAVVGDLTAAHDATGLMAGRHEHDTDVQVIVLNDSGGAIFAGLEHGAAPRQILERFFLTPQRLDLAHLAAGLEADYHRVGAEGLEEILERPVRGRGIVEVTLPAL